MVNYYRGTHQKKTKKNTGFCLAISDWQPWGMGLESKHWILDRPYPYLDRAV